jgi:hypothetical protein
MIETVKSSCLNPWTIALIPVICDTFIWIPILQTGKEVSAAKGISEYADNRMRARCMQAEKSSLVKVGPGRHTMFKRAKQSLSIVS